MLTDFHNSFTFTDRFTSKFATKSSFTIPPHLNCVTTLLCEILVLKIAMLKIRVCKASCHAKLVHSVVKNSLQSF